MTKSVASPTGRVEVVEVQAPDGGKPPPPDVPTGPSPPQRRRRIATASPASPPLSPHRSCLMHLHE